MPTPNTFRFGEGKNVHRLGDESCPACRWDRPQRCDKCGEGLIHIELSNNVMKKSSKVFLYHCDICAGKGKNWKSG